MTRGASPPTIPGHAFRRRLGSGGFADVFLYERALPRMDVAVKVFTFEAASPAVRRRFTDEANAMARLSGHPSIVQVFNADIADDDRPYIVMQYYEGGSLAPRARNNPMPVAEVLGIGVKIASAVEVAHRAEILHRDIKPANILTSRFGEPGLTDFGIATTRENAADAEGLSPPWSPPEVLVDLSAADARSDVYSLGATLWHLLVGHSPFEVPGQDNTVNAVSRRVRVMPPPPTGRDDVPPALERLLRQCLAKDPAERPQTALAVARTLNAIQLSLRLDPTRLHLDPVQGVGAHGGASLGGERTVARVGTDAGETRLRADGSAADEGTVARPGGISAAGAAVRGTSDEGVSALGGGGRGDAWFRRRAGQLAAAGVGVAVLVAAVVLFATRGPSSTRPPSPTTAPSERTAFGPGAPLVTWKAGPEGQVQFTWTYANPLPTDGFRWRAGSGWQITATPTATVTPVPGQPTCIQVEVIRADGEVSPIPQPTCTS